MLMSEQEKQNIHALFFAALYNGSTLQELVDLGQQLIENPILVRNIRGTILAISTGADFGDLHISWESSPFQIIQDNEAHLKKERVQQIQENARSPFFYKNPENEHNWLIANVVVNDICTADISAYSVNRPFTPRDMEIMDILSKAASLELRKGTNYIRTHYTLNSFFLSDLLDGKLNDEKLIRSQLGNMSWQPKEYIYILTVPTGKLHATDVQTQILTDEISLLLPVNINIWYMDTIVFLTTRTTEFTAEQLKPLEDFLKKSGVSAGMSQPFHHLKDARGAYNNSLNVLALAKRLCDEGSLIKYDDYMFLYMIDICSRHTDIENYCHPGVRKIIEYDGAHDTSFYETLRCFLDNALNSTQTSESLHIHRNTLLYRLDKIKQLADIDFSDGEMILKLQISVKIIEYQKASGENR